MQSIKSLVASWATRLRKKRSRYVTLDFRGVIAPNLFGPILVPSAVTGTLRNKPGWKWTMAKKKLIKVAVKWEVVKEIDAGMPSSQKGYTAWSYVTIAPPDKSGEKDPDDYPLYGNYYYRFKPGVEPRWRTQENVSKRLLDKENEELILALKAGLVDQIDL